MARKKKPQTIDNRVTWAQTVRDLGAKSINNGQFPLYCLVCIILLIIVKLPNEELAQIINRLINLLLQLELVAYVLLFIVVLAWYKHAKMVRKAHSEEYKRLGEEKSMLQNMLNMKEYKSSEEKK